MILYPPIRFDLNEWFIIFATIITLVPTLLLPRRFSPAMTLFILTYNLYISHTADYLLGFPPYDLYDVNDSPKYEIFDFVLYSITYPPVTYLFLYLYDRWKWSGFRLIIYIMGCSILTTGMEWLADLAHVYAYKGWRLSYSFLVYIGVYTVNILLFRLAKRLLPRSSLCKYFE